jgi:hypothetical protein
VKSGGPLERRTPLQRGGPLSRSPMPARTTPLPRSAPQRRTVPLQAVRTARTAGPAKRAGAFTATTRRLLWARFAGLCAVCGLPLPLAGWTGQHRRARGTGGSTAADTPSPANGLAVHEVPCHRRIEGYPDWARPLGYRVDQGRDPATVPVRLWDGRTVWLTTDGGYADRPDTEETRAA